MTKSLAPINSIKIFGAASGTILHKSYCENELNKNMLHFLQSKEISIASSCSGKGICKKCIINEKVTSCEITLLEFIEKFDQVTISYL